MEEKLKEKLEKVVEFIRMDMVDPDLEIDYCIPDVSMTSNSCNVSEEPYIIVKYITDEHNIHEKKINIKKIYLKKDPKDLANLITFYIEQFMEEIDSVEYGGE